MMLGIAEDAQQRGAHRRRPRPLDLEASWFVTAPRQAVGQERQVGDHGEDPAEHAGRRRAVRVQVAPAAALRDQGRRNHRKAQPQQADRMSDPADDDQQRHAQEHVRTVERRGALEVKRDWLGHSSLLSGSGHRVTPAWARGPRRRCA
jgi:hypothetical protein